MNTMLIYSLLRLNKNRLPIGGAGGASCGKSEDRASEWSERASEHKIFIGEAAARCIAARTKHSMWFKIGFAANYGPLLFRLGAVMADTL